MTRPMVRIHNSQTNEIIDREMNDEEYAIYEADQIVQKQMMEEEKKKMALKTALLAKLGITEDEAKLLLG